MASTREFVTGMLAEFFKRAVLLTLRLLHFLRYGFFLAALALIAFIFLFCLAAAPYTAAPKYSIYNDNWDGLSYFYSLASHYSTAKADYTTLDELGSLGKGATLVVVAPQRAYSADERRLVREFVERGGTLIVCDAHGHGKELTEEFRVRYSNTTVVDYLSFNRRQDFPVIPFAVGGATGFAFAKFPAVLINYPQSALILASTSPESYLDVNYNLTIDEGDLKGPFAVAAAVDYGEGRVVAVSDADLFSNDMIGRADNVVLADALLATYATDLVIFDETHRFGERDAALLYLFTYRDRLMDVSFVAFIAAATAAFLLAGHRAWAGAERKTIEAQRDLMLHSYRDLVWDISANAKLRAEPYTWIVLMQYDRFRDKLLRGVDPFRRPLENKDLVKRIARKSGWGESDLSGLLERLESIKNGESAVRSLEESTALCRVMDDYLEKLKVVKAK